MRSCLIKLYSIERDVKLYNEVKKSAVDIKKYIHNLLLCIGKWLLGLK